jgi:hypothetical protein
MNLILAYLPFLREMLCVHFNFSTNWLRFMKFGMNMPLETTPTL